MFYRLYDDARNIGNVKIAAIGPATAKRVKDFHLSVDLQPKEFIAEAIIEGLLEFGQRRKPEIPGGESSRSEGSLAEAAFGTWRDRRRGDRLSDCAGDKEMSRAVWRDFKRKERIL